ncbi:MAG: hypothetical protein HND55_09320 [Pseudomonadota bacterium]|nr:MAG: hypothetical protein HND55_09320 [Pseudomonadota bacterium]
MSTSPPGRDRSGVSAIPEPLRILIGLGIGYLRWVSLTPMVVLWAFYAFMVVFMVYVNFEDSFWDGVERGYEVYSEWFGPIAWIEENAPGPESEGRVRDAGEAHQEALQLGLEDVMPWILKAWGIIALAAWLLSLLRSLVFGPRPPRTLPEKLRVLFIAVAAGWILLWVAYFFGHTTYHGSIAGWFALFTGVAILVGAVSAITLMISEVLGFLGKQLEPLPERDSTSGPST